MGNSKKALPPLKRFGQNFLKDKNILEKIIKAIPLSNSYNKIVEIGAGLGDLTKKLLEIRCVKAYEVDKRLCSYLKEEFSKEISEGKLELVCKDVLEEKDSLDKDKFILVANLPYYIATKIILNALRDRNCQELIVMIQKEVALKFCAKSGDREFGSLSILASYCGECEILFDVLPSSFDPMPKVTSSVIRIRKKRSLEDRKFEEFLKVAFSMPRKTLKKNLSKAYPKELIEEIFSILSLEPSIRPHQLLPSEYLKIFSIIKDSSDGREKREYSNNNSNSISNSKSKEK
ncbi:MAG: 16S rRNA (adenine(1518)-N(6)/adenine(1519)-N(6))-dimethyltransferase RsmA [Epsilonproteobacteria bacterium]|nr:16S rRNA (adenine(1518)-N(6)/adenine(1519)-N(6))-dimethyltransferase RsmA [Campylobacterota bacterium]